MVTQETILEALKKIQDPELKRDIVSLGMVKEIEVRDGEAHIHLLISGSAVLKQNLEEQVRSQVGNLEGIRSVNVEASKPSKSPAFTNKLPIPGIQYVVAVASGKGGVGKTTVAVNLALALAKNGYQVGLMDGDIYGPNVPLMLGVAPQTRPHVNDEDKIIPLEAYGIRMISMGVLVPPDQPMVWRGPMLHSAVTQFLQKVDWGKLDFLLVDLPPGTGDVQLSLVQTVPLSGAMIVTTPQEVALMDVRKGIALFRKTEVPILGILENMTGEVFGRGGGRKAALDYQAPFLGEIPLDGRIREGGDAGKPVVVAHPDAPAAKSFFQAADLLVQTLQQVPNPI